MKEPLKNPQIVYCTNCERLVPAENINIVELVAKCGGCDHIFWLSDLGNWPGSKKSADDKSPPSRPSGVKVEQGSISGTRILLSWFSPAVFFLLFFCIAWDSFLVFWYSMALFAPGEGGFQWIAILFPIAHVAVGVSLTYFVVASFLNTTKIEVSNFDVSVRHGPVPWLGNKTINRKDILEIELDYNGSSDSSSGRLKSICAHHQNGDQVVLINSLEKSKADFIAWELASLLKVNLVDKS